MQASRLAAFAEAASFCAHALFFGALASGAFGLYTFARFSRWDSLTVEQSAAFFGITWPASIHTGWTGADALLERGSFLIEAYRASHIGWSLLILSLVAFYCATRLTDAWTRKFREEKRHLAT